MKYQEWNKHSAHSDPIARRMKRAGIFYRPPSDREKRAEWCREHGICLLCTNAIHPEGGILCQYHLTCWGEHPKWVDAEGNAISRLEYEVRRFAGDCVYCGRRPQTFNRVQRDVVYCEKHEQAHEDTVQSMLELRYTIYQLKAEQYQGTPNRFKWTKNNGRPMSHDEYFGIGSQSGRLNPAQLAYQALKTKRYKALFKRYGVPGSLLFNSWIRRDWSVRCYVRYCKRTVVQNLKFGDKVYPCCQRHFRRIFQLKVRGDDRCQVWWCNRHISEGIFCDEHKFLG